MKGGEYRGRAYVDEAIQVQEREEETQRKRVRESPVIVYLSEAISPTTINRSAVSSCYYWVPAAASVVIGRPVAVLPTTFYLLLSLSISISFRSSNNNHQRHQTTNDYTPAASSGQTQTQSHEARQTLGQHESHLGTQQRQKEPFLALELECRSG